MSLTRHHGGLVIVLSFAVALLLTIMPLPDNLRLLRPDWVALTLIFWSLTLPDRISVTTGFFVGLLLDVLSGTLLGQHALSLSLIAYICARLHQRIRLYPLWQQTLTVVVMLILQQLITLWISNIIDLPSPPLSYWLPSLTGMLLWPFLQRFLTAVRINFAVQ